jgi:hypothetical protein
MGISCGLQSVSPVRWEFSSFIPAESEDKKTEKLPEKYKRRCRSGRKENPST